MKQSLTLTEADKFGDRFKVFEGAESLVYALTEQMIKGGFFYTQVDTKSEPMYLQGVHIVNRTGIYAVLDVHEKLTCDVCKKEYVDAESIALAKKLQSRWVKLCNDDSVEVRGICPCPMQCKGQMILSEY